MPQIITNYRRKSGAGLSYGMLFALFNALVWLLYCYLCLPMPFFYRVSLILQIIGCGIWFVQRFYYASWASIRVALALFMLNLGIILAAVPFALHDPLRFGNGAGWLGICLLLINRAPQVMKVFRERSVEGFNFGFVFLQGCAAVMALTIACTWGLPMQAVCTSGIAFLCFVVFTYQFWLYKWRLGRSEQLNR